MLALAAVAVIAIIAVAFSDARDPAEALAHGKELLRSGDVASAVIELKNAVQEAPEDADARATLGLAYLQIRNAPAALKELRRARSLGRQSDELNQAITRALILSGEMDEAATELALNSDDSNPQWLTLQGLLDLAVGRFEEARTGLERALEIEPNNIEARRAAVSAAIRLGEPAAARVEVDAALKLTQDDFDVWILKGELDRHDENYQDAIEAYTRALEIIPGSPLALLQRAGARVALEDIDGAINDLDAIGDASNEDPRAVFLRALIARHRGQTNAALRYLRQILVVIPDHRPSLMQAARIHYEAGEFTQAAEYVERLLAVDPGNAEYQRMRGAIQFAAGHLDTGFGDQENVEIADYTDPNLLALLGTAYLRHGKIEQGTESLKRALELDPKSVPIRTQLAFSRMRAGEFNKALEELAAVRRDDPNFMLAAVLQTFGHAALKQNDEAFAIADELIKSNPEAPIVRNLRGYLHASLGDDAAARKDFEAAVTADSAFFPAYFNLARLAIKDGDHGQAGQVLQKVLDQNPNQAQALLYLAAVRQREDDQDGAVKLWIQSAGHNPDSIEPRVFLSRHFRRIGDVTNATRYAEEAFRVGPYVPAAQFEFATLKLFAGEAEEAGPAIEALIERFPNAKEPLELKARAQEMTGALGPLKDTLQQLIDLAPTSPRPRVAMARLHLQQREFAEARKLAESLRDDDRFAAEGFDLLGDVRYAEGSLSQAAQAYEKSHELKATSQSLLKLNAVKRRLGGDGSAMLDEWLSTNPDDAGVRMVKATTDLEEGKTEIAVANYEKVLESAPENIVALNNLAWLYDERDDPRALDYAKRAHELAPARPEISDTYGWILFRAGNLEQALELLQNAAAGDGENADIRFHLASALAATGSREQALEHLDAILSDEVQFPSRADAQALRGTLRP
jgi:putative PEP-CTERM system TPR-repeat lipoprotein